MYLHPSMIMFMVSLIFSIMMITSSPSWFTAWIALEFNMLAFIPMILKKKNKYSAESSLKYFLTQALASIMIIVSIISLTHDKYLPWFIMAAALALKIGAAPLHQWMPSLIEGLTWQTLVLFLILQKINPLILMSFIYMKQDITNMLIFILVIMSALIGSLGGLTQTSLRKIMVYSSISHIAWMLSAIYSDSNLWVLYYSIYSMILITVLTTFNNKQTFNLNQLIKQQKVAFYLMSISFLSLAGLPPFSGFAPKFLISISLINQGYTSIFYFLLFSTFMSLFFYMRVILTNTMLFKSTNTHFNEMNTIKKTDFINMLLLMAPMIMFLM